MTGMMSPDAGAASLRAMIDHLTGPLAAGADYSRYRPDAAGLVPIPAARRATLSVILAQSLETQRLTVTATLNGSALEPIAFAPWSEAGSTLLVWAGGEDSAAADLTLGAALDGAALLADALADWLEVAMVSGNIGKLLAIIGDEKARLRRETTVLAAMRQLRFAADDALDRTGTELAVPRLDSTPSWNAGRGEIIAVPERESDISYRNRLAVWRPFMAPTPRAVQDMLTAVDSRITIEEPGRPFSAAIRIIGALDDDVDPARRFFLQRMRTDRLIFLTPAGDAVIDARPSTADGKAQEQASRDRIAAAFDTVADAAVSTKLAAALDQAARVLTALGAPRLMIDHAQTIEGGGSRYELGMGVSVTLPAIVDADGLHATLLDSNRPDSGDALAETLIVRARATPIDANDRSLDWLWDAAGLATHHRIDVDHVYLSHLSSGGLTINISQRTLGDMTVRAVFNAAGDSGRTAALQGVLDHVEAQPPGPVTVVAKADTGAAIAPAIDLAAEATENTILAAAGLLPSIHGSSAVTALNAMPDDLWAVLALDGALAGQIRVGDVAAVAPLSAIAADLRAAGAVSLLPIITATQCLLAVGVVALPTAGVNLGERTATGVRWIVVPLKGTATLSRQAGFATRLHVSNGGLCALMALGYIRDAAPDPYEIRVSLPEGELLDLAGYERVMNALERAFPIGVEINSWTLRQQHVDLDGDGSADPLPPNLARHYRQFRMPRTRGMEEPEDAFGDIAPS